MNDLTKIKASTQYQDEPEIDFRGGISTILSGMWLILFFTIVFMLLSIVYATSINTLYQGNLLLKVEPQKAGIPGVEVLAGIKNNDTSVSTEVEIIKSRRILRSAVEKARTGYLGTAKEDSVIK